MSDLVTTQVFSNGETGITATKMNNIVGQASIQTDFFANKPLASSVASNDQLLLLTSGGPYARTNFSTLSDSVAASPSVTAVRLRSFNAVGNPNFEVDQRNCFAAMNNSPNLTFLQDRWIIGRSGTMAVNWQGTFTGVNVPGQSFMITRQYQHCVLTTQQTTLGATDNYGIYQFIEGTQWRELAGDVTSFSLLVRSSVAGLKFSVALRDAPGTYSLVKLCTIPSANTWTLITLPNIPLPGGGTFNYQPGNVGYTLNITLSVGSTYIAPAADTWQTGGPFIGAPGMDNFCGKANGSSFDIAFVQHEPGPQCTTLMDKPFTQNLDECLRYFTKNYNYSVAPGTVTATGAVRSYIPASSYPIFHVPFKKPMAKTTPTITLYSSVTGASGNIRDLSAGVDKSVSGISDVGEFGFAGATVTSPNAAVWQAEFYYTADTGW